MLGRHIWTRADGFIEPSGALIEQIPEVIGIVGIECQRVMPVRIRAIHHPRKAALKGVGFRHCFANERTFGEDPGLSRVWLEWLSLFDPQWLQHGVEETIALVDRLVLDHFVDSLPILHSARWHGAPFLSLRRHDLRRRRIGTLSIRIGSELRE